MNTLVMKFGGAAVATPLHFSKIAEIILDRRRYYSKIVVVVSAMGDTTNQLIALASQVSRTPPRREYDMLVSVGERISISLLAMALAEKGHEAVSFTGSQSGIITCENHSEANILEIKPHRIVQKLDNGSVVIVAGFQGVSKKGEITTLGRGGSDTSAVAVAVALGAQKVEFFKDVEGIYNQDPKLNPSCTMFDTLSYSEALSIVRQGAKVLHPRSIELAKRNNMPLHVRSFINYDANVHSGTIIRSNSQDVSVSKEPVYEQDESRCSLS